jgi:hypothetical protein
LLIEMAHFRMDRRPMGQHQLRMALQILQDIPLFTILRRAAGRRM